MAHYVIYVPGLGDHHSFAQRLAIKLWRLYGVRGIFQSMHWNDGGPFGPKLQQLLDRIDQLAKAGHKVSLVAASAGASVALVAYHRRKQQVSGVVCVCGKINHIDAVNPAYYLTNPAFRESLAALADAFPKLIPKDRTRIMSIHPLYDEIVPVGDTIIPGAKEKTIPVVGHAIGIAYVLTFGAHRVMRFLRRAARG